MGGVQVVLRARSPVTGAHAPLTVLRGGPQPGAQWVMWGKEVRDGHQARPCSELGLCFWEESRRAQSRQDSGLQGSLAAWATPDPEQARHRVGGQYVLAEPVSVGGCPDPEHQQRRRSPHSRRPCLTLRGWQPGRMVPRAPPPGSAAAAPGTRTPTSFLGRTRASRGLHALPLSPQLLLSPAPVPPPLPLRRRAPSLL